MDETSARRDLVKGCRILFACGAVGDGVGGHLSVRLDAQRILIKPRPVSWNKVLETDLVVMDFDGKRLDGQATSRSAVWEWPIHTQVYLAREDVQSVMHAHPLASTLMAALDIEIEPLTRETSSLTGQVPVHDNGDFNIDTVDRGDAMVSDLGRHRALLLKHHGTVVTGRDVGDLCLTARRLELAAETMLKAAAIRPLPIMSRERSALLMSPKLADADEKRSKLADERWQMMQDYFLEE